MRRFLSLRSRRLEVVGTRKNGRARRRHARGEVEREGEIVHVLLIDSFLALRG